MVAMTVLNFCGRGFVEYWQAFGFKTQLSEVMTLFTTFFGLVTVLGPDSEPADLRSPWLAWKVYYAFSMVGLVITLLSTIMYWTIVRNDPGSIANQAADPVFAFHQLMTHTVCLVILLVDLALSSAPFWPRQYVITFIYALVYIAMMIPVTLKVKVLYAFIDWKSWLSPVIVTVMVLFGFVIHLLAGLF